MTSTEEYTTTIVQTTMSVDDDNSEGKPKSEYRLAMDATIERIANEEGFATLLPEPTETMPDIEAAVRARFYDPEDVIDKDTFDNEDELEHYLAFSEELNTALDSYIERMEAYITNRRAYRVRVEAREENFFTRSESIKESLDTLMRAYEAQYNSHEKKHKQTLATLQSVYDLLIDEQRSKYTAWIDRVAIERYLTAVIDAKEEVETAYWDGVGERDRVYQKLKAKLIQQRFDVCLTS
jgi:hypothetical protein